jgi:hypothetical protein
LPLPLVLNPFKRPDGRFSAIANLLIRFDAYGVPGDEKQSTGQRANRQERREIQLRS